MLTIFLFIFLKKGFRKIRREEDKDPKTYTEFWRKQNKGSKGDTQHMNDPFDIGIITSFTKENHGGVKLNVSVFFINILVLACQTIIIACKLCKLLKLKNLPRTHGKLLMV